MTLSMILLALAALAVLLLIVGILVRPAAAATTLLVLGFLLIIPALAVLIVLHATAWGRRYRAGEQIQAAEKVNGGTNADSNPA
jgi:hypothetical protein